MVSSFPYLCAVPKVIAKVDKKQESLHRFLGEEARVINDTVLDINNCIKAEWFDVMFDSPESPEERGHLYLFPIDDGKFCLQLFYLQEVEKDGTATVSVITFLPGFFDQYSTDVLMANQPFRFDQTTDHQFSVCSQGRLLLGQLQQSINATPFIKSLQQCESATQLLRRALQCITMPFNACQVPACRFLAFENEREKIFEARLAIEQNIDQPQTIKELARKVAMNECYLKKGFKALVGKTIHEYQQGLRIAKAKELLQQQNVSVTEVANTLGFSSISHFSTAFKKATGMKPCELLS